LTASLIQRSTPAMCTVAHERATSGSRATIASRIARCSATDRFTAPVSVSPRQILAR